MSRPRNALLLLGAIVPSMVVAVSTAIAGPPTPTNKAIVPAKSIGGLSLGASYADVQRLWGTDNTCGAEDAAAGGPSAARATFSGTCSWTVTPGQVPNLSGAASVVLTGGKVVQIQISGAITAQGKPLSSGPMGTFKTKKGKLTFGSSISKVVKYYPKTKGSPEGVAISGGGHTMTFGVSSGKIYVITLK